MMRTFNVRILLQDFLKNPQNAIEELCGKGVTAYAKTDIILPDGYCIVRVEQRRHLSLQKIYYIDRTKIKRIATTSNKGSIDIEGVDTDGTPVTVPVNISLTIPQSFKKMIPVCIQLQSQTTGAYLYYATPIMNPLSIYSSASAGRFIGLRRSYGFYCDEVKQEYPDSFKPTISTTLEETIAAYRTRCKSFPMLESIGTTTGIKHAKRFEDCVPVENTGYVIDVSLLPDETISGAILITEKRVPSLVLYWPAPGLGLTISVEEIASIKRLIANDIISFGNYMFYVH